MPSLIYLRMVLLSGLLLLLGGCSTLEINSDYDPAFDFFPLRTYAWMLEPPPPTGDPRIDSNTLLQARIRAAVDRELAAKGYELVTEGTPDFFVGYYATLDSKVNITVIDDYYHYSPYHWWPRSRTYVYDYEEGTLIVDFVEPDSRKLIWRGSVRDEVNFADRPETRERKINEAVHHLLARFPPQVRNKP